MHKQILELSRTALLSNIDKLKNLAGREKEIMAVVKANAYGHGLTEMATLLKDQITWFGVDNIDEALLLRRTLGKNSNILVLGYTPLSRLSNALDNDISLTVYNLETIQALKNSNAKVHLKIESGMHRQGVLPNDIEKIAVAFKETNIQIEGVSTHFADPEDKEFTQKQIDSFLVSLEKLKGLGINPLFVHSSASFGFFLFPNAPGNMLRIGKALYGFVDGFDPVLTWKTIVAQVKKVEPGESVGYGHTWTAKETTTIAVIPVGYADGFDRGLGNCGRVIIKGESVKVVGRVAMNMFMVDITSIPEVAIEEEVVIIGKQGNAIITADEVASKIGSISHEVLSRISPFVPKIII